MPIQLRSLEELILNRILLHCEARQVPGRGLTMIWQSITLIIYKRLPLNCFYRKRTSPGLPLSFLFLLSKGQKLNDLVWCVEKKKKNSWKQGLRIARPRLEGISWITNRKSWCVLRFPTAIAKIWRQVHRSFTSPLRILKIIRNDSLHGLRTPNEAF